MSTLPDYERAVIPAAKLRYCLDPSHPEGMHKARVFESALGLAAADQAKLEQMIRAGIATHDARLAKTYIDGTDRWVVEWVLLARLGPMRMITAWNHQLGAGGPSLVSCYLKKGKR